MKAVSFNDWIQNNLFNDRGKLNPRASNYQWWVKRQKENIWEWIHKQTEFLSADVSFKERIHCVLNGLTQIPTCKVCSNPVKYSSIEKTYSVYCSNSCVNKDGKYLQKKKNLTSILKYGHVKNFSSEQHQHSAQQTMIKKYGVSNAAKNAEIQEKIKNTHVEKYGNHYTKTQEYRSKLIETCKQKYGSNHWMKTDHYRNFIGEHSRKLNQQDLNNIQQQYQNGTAMQRLAESYDISYSHMNKVIKKLGMDADLPQNKINYANSFISSGESELRDIVREIYPNDYITYNDRQLLWPLELDIVNHTRKIAIEFNGTYWHSDFFKHKTYHKEKLEKVEELGYSLISIFDNVYYQNRKILIDKLYSKGRQPYVHARQTIVKNISYLEVKSFLEETHIQGPRTSKLNYGVFDKHQKLLAVATFNAFRDGLELIRFSSNVRIPGILQKIIKQVPDRPIYSFANRCYTYRYNNVYLHNGFEEIEISNPNYFYRKGDTVLTRNQCMKHKLPKLLNNFFDPTLSEYKNMISAGYHRWWDCGNILYKLNN